MKVLFDIIVVGSGPAGLSAAITANEFGLKVLVIDEQSEIGGQVYKSIGKNLDRRKTFLGEDYFNGKKLYEKFLSSKIEYWLNTSVWQINENKEVCFKRNEKTGIIKANFIIICGGAYERPMPITGWTLPGVMTVGAAQTLLKTSSVGADNSIFIGSGPLFYLTVYQYLKAGFKVKSVIDTTKSKQMVFALPYFLFAILRIDLILKGMFWMKYISKHTRVFKRPKKISILGLEKAESVAITLSGERLVKLESNNIFLHQGVIPNINLTMATGIKHHWNQLQRCWVPTLSNNGETSIDGIYVAGDNGEIGGVNVATLSGQIASLDILQKLKKLVGLRKYFLFFKLIREKALRPFLDKLFQPDKTTLIPDNKEEIVCRCENIKRVELEESIELGISGPNQLKSYSRAGMGNCQGRMCGLTVQSMIAIKQNRSLSEVGYYRLRPPIKPITIKELSSLEEYSLDEGE